MENDQVAMLEINEEDEEDYEEKPPKNNYSQSITLYNEKGTKLDEAQTMLDDLVVRFEAYKEGNFPVPNERSSVINSALK